MNRNHISVSLRRAGSRLFFHSAGVIAILVLLAWSAPAQEMRAIAGKVIDDEGRAIPDVTVTVKSRPQVTSTTDSDGQFSITATEVDTLCPGTASLQTP